MITFVFEYTAYDGGFVESRVAYTTIEPSRRSLCQILRVLADDLEREGLDDPHFGRGVDGSPQSFSVRAAKSPKHDTGPITKSPIGAQKSI